MVLSNVNIRGFEVLGFHGNLNVNIGGFEVFPRSQQMSGGRRNSFFAVFFSNVNTSRCKLLGVQSIFKCHFLICQTCQIVSEFE